MHKEHWQQLLESFKEEIPPHDFETWFLTINYIKSDEKEVFLSVPTKFHRDFIADNFLVQINHKLNNIAGELLSVKLAVSTNGDSKSTESSKEEEKETPDTTETIEIKPRKYKFLKEHNMNMIPGYTFERFVVGKNNELAHAAALKVAQTPGTAYNPLFIYGGVGLGKTHLMHAIGQKVKKKDINMQVACLTSEEFLNLFVESIRKNTGEKFRNEFRNLDVLLLDDVQFLLNAEGTKTELFSTFNALHQRKKQIILTSDRTPKQLKLDGMDDRLASRFGWGLDVEIRPPSIETRQAIIKAKIAEEKIIMPNQVINLIASIIDDDIRILEQALTKVIAHYRLLKQAITIEFAQDILQDFITTAAPKNVSVEDIIRETSNIYNISKADIKSKQRTAHINQARQVAMYLTRELTQLSLKEIGQEFGREHPTVISGVRKIEKEVESNTMLRDKIEEITRNLKH